MIVNLMAKANDLLLNFIILNLVEGATIMYLILIIIHGIRMVLTMLNNHGICKHLNHNVFIIIVQIFQLHLFLDFFYLRNFLL